MPVHIQLNELESILELLMKKIQSLNTDSVVINTDAYKIIGTDEWEDFSHDTDPDIGSLRDDWSSLRLLLDDQERVFTSVDIDRIASVLRALSEKLSSSTPS